MSAARWSIEHDVRDDAESVFVPVEQLPDAAVGDTVELCAEERRPRVGVVADRLDDPSRGSFVVVRLDE